LASQIGLLFQISIRDSLCTPNLSNCSRDRSLCPLRYVRRAGHFDSPPKVCYSPTRRDLALSPFWFFDLDDAILNLFLSLDQYLRQFISWSANYANLR
jgi:hypothetical protein